jgi:hypothetical protein
MTHTRKAAPAILQENFLRKLHASGLTEADAERLQMETHTAASVKASLDIPAFDGFRIPYFDEKGKPTGFYRFRYLVDTRTGFAKLTEGKAQRYAQPKDTINEVYMPPLPGMEWPKLLSGGAVKDRRLIITEGELKAACACKQGFATAGLGGVWCWRSAKRDLTVLPWFDRVAWEALPTYIIFDSDIKSNPQVMQAERALMQELLKRGAEPYPVRLPAKDGVKVGLDDFLVAEGKEALKTLLTDTEPFRAAAALHGLNAKVTYVRDPGFVLTLDTHQHIPPKAFSEHSTFSKKTYTIDLGEKTKTVYAAAQWLKWPARSEVERITYRPGEGQIVGGNEFNVWEGWGVEPKAGDVEPWTDLLTYLFGADDKARTWFEQWCAYPLQHPGAKLYQAVCLWGQVHGTGKSMIGDTLKMIYGKNATSIGDKELSEPHNDWQKNKQFVMGDDVTSGDARRIADRLKSMITQSEVRLNPKYIPAYTVPDCINYYFTSNHPNAFHLEDSDRRFFIHHVQDRPRSAEFYEDFVMWQQNGGAAALFDHLLKLDLTGYHAKGHAYQTEAKVEMIESGRSDIARWVAAVIKSPDVYLRLGDVRYKSALWSSDDLLRLYDPDERKRITVNGISRELHRLSVPRPARGEACPTHKGFQRLWVLRPFDKWDKMTRIEAGQRYDSEREMKGEGKVAKFSKKSASTEKPKAQ